MKHIIKYFIIIFISILSFSVLLSQPIYAEDICANEYIDEDIKSAAGCDKGNSGYLPDIVKNIIEAIILVLGIVAVIFIIIGGVQYMTSIGDAGKVKKAKDTILYAVIGLVICILSYVIVNFVIDLPWQSTRETPEQTKLRINEERQTKGNSS